MKIRVIMTIIILCLSGVMAIVTPVSASKPQPLKVWVPTQYPTIQEGVNAVAEYGVVHVLAGTYNEHITINKPLTLAGKNKATTTIDGSGGGEVVSVSNTHDVEISGFTIQNGLCGIQLWGSNGNTITDNIIHDMMIGVNLDSSHNAISRNVIYNNQHGIVLYGSACYNRVTFNILYGNGLEEGVGAICIHAKSWGLPTNNMICFNLIAKNQRGIQYPTLEQNPEVGNTIDTVMRYPPAYDNVILPNWNTESILWNWEPYTGYIG